MRSEEPLYADGDITAYITRLRRQYEKSNSGLDYEQWVRQTWLISGSSRRELSHKSTRRKTIVTAWAHKLI